MNLSQLEEFARDQVVLIVSGTRNLLKKASSQPEGFAKVQGVLIVWEASFDSEAPPNLQDQSKVLTMLPCIITFI